MTFEEPTRFILYKDSKKMEGVEGLENKIIWIYNIYVSELYIVGTPIGNLGDITFRALETLKSVDVVAAEDTRHTLELLSHFEIRKPMLSCRSQNEKTASEKIIALLDEGKTVAYASDAGEPGISDPGAVLAGEVRKAGHKVVPIPGPSAFATLVSVAGCGGKTLVFEGFLSPKPGRRRKRLRELMAMDAAVVVYESPFRVVKLLTDIAEIDPDRRIVVGRELTKLHEEINDGTASEILADYSGRTKVLGEFAIFISESFDAQSSNKNVKLLDSDSDNNREEGYYDD